MHDSEIKQMLIRVHDEIVTLRDQIERLAPKADAYDSIRAVLDLLPKPSQGYGEDVLWRIKKELQDLEEKKGRNKKPIPAEWAESDPQPVEVAPDGTTIFPKVNPTF